ncbi:hypothetical protein FRB99_008513, partial [Tulasnella sp. 403]
MAIIAAVSSSLDRASKRRWQSILTTTKASSWEKPDDLKSPFEKALSQTKWKEYSSQGRKYWYNTDSKESKWEMPPELVEIMEKVEKEKALVPSTPARPVVPPNFIPAGQSGFAPVSAATLAAGSTPSLPLNPLAASAVTTPRLPLSASSVLPARPNLPDDPVIPVNGFPTHEDAEKAFMHLLKKAGVDPTWTWDATMRAIITDPLYKALSTLAEKKAAWQKYNDDIKAKAAEERETRLNRLRPGFKTLLVGNPDVKYYSTFKTVDKLFSQHPTWLAAKIEEERRYLFEEHVSELKRIQLNDEREARNRAVAKLVELFKVLQVDVVTRWRDAQAAVVESPEYKSDPELRSLPALDMLLSFEDYSRILERDWEESQRKKNIENTRKERKAREGFCELLESLKASGDIRAKTKWKNVFPLVGDDPRYLSMLGNAGSNPLELFWDMVDELDQQLEAKEHIVQKALDSRDFQFTENTTFQELSDVIRGDEGVSSLTGEDIREVYNSMRNDLIKKAEDARRKAERRLRHLQDDLRYALKKLGSAINIDEPYEVALPQIQDLPEFKAIEDEEARKAAFSKFVKRQREKLKEASEDGASVASRRHKEPHGRDRGDSKSRAPEEEHRSASKGAPDKDEPSSRRSRHHESASVHSAGDRDKDRDRRESDRYRDYRDRDRHRDSDRDRERERDRDKDRDRDRGERSSRRDRDKDRSRRDGRDDYERRLSYGYDDKEYRRDRRREHGGRDRDDDWDRERDRERRGGHRERERRDGSREDRGREREADEGHVDEPAAKKPKVETQDVEMKR